jgi:hypothetical protein
MISELLAASSTSDCVIRRDGDDSLTMGCEQLLRMDTSDDRSHLLWRQGPLLYDMTSIMLETGKRLIMRRLFQNPKRAVSVHESPLMPG